MKMEARSTFVSSGIGRITKGATFEVSEARGKEFEKRGLAVPVKGAERTPDAKADAPAENKMEAAPANKAESKPRAKKAD